jgi:hypothetical protein
LANGFTLEIRFKCFALTPQAIISIRGDHNSMCDMGEAFEGKQEAPSHEEVHYCNRF